MTDVLCRTCLCWEPHGSSLTEYFKDEDLHLYEIIMSFCQVQIKFNENFPTDVCNACLNDIKKAYSFKIKCERSDNILRQRSSTLNDNHTDPKGFVGALQLSQSTEHNNTVNAIIKSEDGNFIEYEDDKDDGIDDDTDYKDIVVKDDEKQLISTPCNKVNEIIKNEDRSISRQIKSKKVLSRRKVSKIKSTENRFRVGSLKKCPYCDLEFKWSNQLKDHVSTHTGEKPFSCDLCNSKFTRSSSLKAHRLIHSDEKPHSCPHCDYKCSSLGNMNRHIKLHTNEKPYSCDMCSYKCFRASYLKEHQKRHTDERPYLCDQCHYTCRTPSALKIHKTHKHSTERKFCCDQCGFKCKTRGGLITHIMKHSGIKKFSCELCPYQSLYLLSLENHKLTVHSDERPFACDKCSYKCINRHYLKIHQRNHLTVKKFACNDCDYTCHTIYQLKIHRLTHTGERPYRCDVCDFRFSQSSSLKRHQKKSHGIFGVK